MQPEIEIPVAGELTVTHLVIESEDLPDDPIHAEIAKANSVNQLVEIVSTLRQSNPAAFAWADLLVTIIQQLETRIDNLESICLKQLNA